MIRSCAKKDGEQPNSYEPASMELALDRPHARGRRRGKRWLGLRAPEAPGWRRKRRRYTRQRARIPWRGLRPRRLRHGNRRKHVSDEPQMSFK